MLPSPDAPFSLAALWHALFWPLLRLLLGLAVGLLIANLLEALRWTRYLARLAAPLARTAHLREVAGASFSLAFVSPAAANGLLSDSHGAGEISGRELMLANLFNSLPAYLVHTPTIFLLTWPVLGAPAVTYVGLTLLAAAGRTGFTVLLARRLLPPPPPGCLVCKADGDARTDWGAALRKAWKRFLRRLPKLVYFTVPVYVLMYLLQLYGFFNLAEEWLAAHMGWLSFLKPQAMGIIVLHLAAELGAALGALGLYGPFAEWAGAGATVPLPGFGNLLARGVREAVAEHGLLGALTGGLSAAAAGITAAMCAGALAAVIFKPHEK